MTTIKEAFDDYLSLHVKKFEKGVCFICQGTNDMHPEGFVHYQCANALEDRKRQAWEDFRNSPQAKADSAKLRAQLEELRRDSKIPEVKG